MLVLRYTDPVLFLVNQHVLFVLAQGGTAGLLLHVPQRLIYRFYACLRSLHFSMSLQ